MLRFVTVASDHEDAAAVSFTIAQTPLYIEVGNVTGTIRNFVRQK